jgi:hypothetical protein
MPNWVFNHLTIKGSEEDITKVKAQLNKPFTRQFKEDDEPTLYSNPVIAFWNIIAPPEDKIDEYFGVHGYADGKKQGDSEYNWYNFNRDKWGTKWDVGVADKVRYPETELQEETNTKLHYKFDTAWSPPTPVIEELSRQYPELEITLSYEEEGEWGGEIEYLDGEEVSVTEYDAPSSHKDYVDRDKEDNCVCGREEDKSEWYDDCPGAKAKEIKLFATQDVVILN